MRGWSSWRAFAEFVGILLLALFVAVVFVGLFVAMVRVWGT